MVLAGLVGLSLLAPVAILLASVTDFSALRQFWSLQWDGLANSLAAAVLASALALAMAAGSLAVERLGRGGRFVARLMQGTILLATFLPGSLVGAAILAVENGLDLGPISAAGGIGLVAAGQAARFAGIALVVLLLRGTAPTATIARWRASTARGRSRHGGTCTCR